MIAVSLLLIAGAITLLILGLWLPSSALLGGSIAASLLAAVLLVIGARRAVPRPEAAVPRGRGAPPSHRERGAERVEHRGRGEDGDRAEPPRRPEHPGGWPERGEGRPERPEGRTEQPPQSAEPVTTTIPAQQGPLRNGSTHVTEPIVLEPAGHPAGPAEPDEPEDDLDEDPPDEPAPQQVSAADAARVGRMATEVLVVDGRPRYHLPGCVHLLGRESEPLPVGEAIELGFSPCSLCEPDSALLADARRV